MKAIRMHRFGGPEVLQPDEIEQPKPQAGEILIRVSAASVNPVDYKMRQGGYPMAKPEDLPIILGRDVAGVVAEAGGSGFKAGDEVYVHLDWKRGGYAEFVATSERGVAKKPQSLDMIAAAAVPLAAITAWQGLFTHGGLQAGQRVLIHAASGGVGGFAVQFAKAHGAYVYATASGGGVKLVREYGADEVIDYKNQKFEDVAKNVDLVFDLVGKDTQERSWSLLKDGGCLISTVQEPDSAKKKAKNAKAERYMAEPNAGQLAEIARLIDAGKVKVTVAKVFGLNDAADAHRFLENGHPNGKVVLRVS